MHSLSSVIVRCQQTSFPQALPSASVVICFFNEAFSALLRTIHSVLDRSPTYLLHEIILVDDHSELGNTPKSCHLMGSTPAAHLCFLCDAAEELKDNLDRYVRTELQPKVHLVRNQRREGLIRGRMIGASHATGTSFLLPPSHLCCPATYLCLCPGEVLVFLDSHCEVNQAWLQPLLAPIQRDQRTVVCPVIDIISADTLTYSPSPIVRGGFNWGLHFKWDPVPPSELNGPEGASGPIRYHIMGSGTKHFFLHLLKRNQVLLTPPTSALVFPPPQVSHHGRRSVCDEQEVF